MTTVLLSTKDDVIAKIIDLSGYTEDEATQLFDDILRTKKQGDVKSIYEFCQLAHPGDEARADVHFVTLLLDVYVPHKKKVQLSPDASVSDSPHTINVNEVLQLIDCCRANVNKEFDKLKAGVHTLLARGQD